MQRLAVSTSVTDRPTRTAAGHIGSVRKRSTMPVLRSTVKPTAVPMLDVVRLRSSNPASAKLAYVPPGTGMPEPKT